MLPLAFLALSHLYIGWRIVPFLSVPAGSALCAVLLGSLLLIPAGFFGRRTPDRRTADRWTWAGMLALGSFAVMLVLTLLRDLLLVMAWPFAALLPPLAAPSAQALPLVALVMIAWSVANARRTARVRRVDVRLAGLAEPLHGFSIAQLSDVHVGPTVKRPYVQGIVDRVNGLDVDVVAITGDLVDGRVQDLHEDVAPLAGLRARHGRYFVTGNHEYYSGAREWIAHLRSLGLQVLMNEHVVLAQGNARLVLAGVTDAMAHQVDPGHRSDPAAALAGAPADARPRVLLAHQPRSADAAARAGFDLQLSGHTHGGQIWPFNFFVPLQQPYVAGLHRLGQLWVYTSRGTGYWGPPLRLLAPSEITLIRLVPA
jgi:uncharacterized protein